MKRLRSYQQELKDGVKAAWAAGHRVVLAVSPARSGKTVLFSDLINENAGGTVAIAHRARLVEQMSFALACAGVRHRVIGPASLQRACAARHMRKLQRNFIDPNSLCAVASVNTLCKRREAWFDHVTLWVTDEGHHLTLDSMWGRACALFTHPNVHGLLVTATPLRADGKGLGRHADGLADVMVLGKSPRELIEMGYICDYRLAIADSDINLANVHVGASGEFVAKELSAAVHESKRFVGDVVREYLRHGKGKPGITFAVDVKSASDIVEAYRAAGVPAEIVTADTDDALRLSIMAEFEAGRLKQLVNVDLFGEGVDLPDVHVVSMARHTNSYGLFIQQFWRGGTLLLADDQHRAWTTFTDEERRAQIAASAKPKFLVIDHVGNVMRHARARGLPCAKQRWSLDARERGGGGGGGAADDVIPLRACANGDAISMRAGAPGSIGEFLRSGWTIEQVVQAGHAEFTGIPCGQAYERVLDFCPHCGFVTQPTARNGPQHVDGNINELDDVTLALLRGEVVKAETAPEYNRWLGDVVNRANANRHKERMDSQGHLRDQMQLFCAYQMDHLGRSAAEMHKRFYFAFEIDSLSAQALGARDAEAVRAKIAAWMDRNYGVIEDERC